MKRISRTFALLLTVALLLGCIPSMQVFAESAPRASTQSIRTSDGTNSTSEILPSGNSITTEDRHYYKDITLTLNLPGSGSAAPSVKVQGHTFTSFAYSPGSQLLLTLKNVDAYASPSNNMIHIEVAYEGRTINIYMLTFFYNGVDTSKPYLEGKDMWDFDGEELPNVYSPVVVAQKAHRYTYSFRGALIMPDAESFQVTFNGEIMTGATVTKKTALGYGMSLYEFSLYPFPYTIETDADGYSTVDFIGTNAAGYQNHVILKCRFVYR